MPTLKSDQEEKGFFFHTHTYVGVVRFPVNGKPTPDTALFSVKNGLGTRSDVRLYNNNNNMLSLSRAGQVRRFCGRRVLFDLDPEITNGAQRFFVGQLGIFTNLF